MKIQAYGIETQLPRGWEGRIFLRKPGAMGQRQKAAPPGEAAPDPTTPDSAPSTSSSTTTSPSTTVPGRSERSAAPRGAPSPTGEPSTTTSPSTTTAPPTTTSKAAPEPTPETTWSPGNLATDDGEAWPVSHLANFPLPEDRGDFGSGAVDLMHTGDVLVVLSEYGPECVGTKLFARRGLPTKLTPNMFSGHALQRAIPGQAGCQLFFTVGNRAFCLYTVLGRQADAAKVLPQVNSMLAAVRIQPR